MNKKGYTLAEALITLGIIGIIAALVVPAANKARPNENKMKFLQTYDAIETQIKNFTQNSRYFPTCQDNLPDPDNPEQTITRCFPDYPLYNTSGGVVDERNIPILISTPGADPQDRPLPANYNPATDGQHKLCYLLADAMGGVASVSRDNSRCTFTTPNGVAFAMGETLWRRPNSPFMITPIVFDVTGVVPNNINIADILIANAGFFLDFSDGSIQDTRAFLLYVTSDGKIIPADIASRYFLATRKASGGSNISNDDVKSLLEQQNNAEYGISIMTTIGNEFLRNAEATRWDQ